MKIYTPHYKWGVLYELTKGLNPILPPLGWTLTISETKFLKTSPTVKPSEKV